MISARTSHLRTRHGHEHHRVTFVELFFDLVFVFAVTQLSHGLLEHLTPLGALQTAILLLAVWWTWIDTAWITNWLDPDKPAVRVMLFVLMLAGLVLSASIPKAFGERALAFAVAYIAMQALRDMFMLWALHNHDAGNHRNFVRISIWHIAWRRSGCRRAGRRIRCAWRCGRLRSASRRSRRSSGFWVPVLGRSSTADWHIEGAHMAERCGLFIIIALGESVLITGQTFAGLTWNAASVAAFAVAFLGSVAMWMVYFNIGAERSSKLAAASDDPGRIARNGYTYLHILIVAGIIVAAVGDELVLHHPGGHTDVKTAAVIIGGPALYLFGNMLFKRLSAPHFPLSHIVGLGLLALLIPAAIVAPPLLLSALATAVLIVVVAWEWMSLRRTA